MYIIPDSCVCVCVCVQDFIMMKIAFLSFLVSSAAAANECKLNKLFDTKEGVDLTTTHPKLCTVTSAGVGLSGSTDATKVCIMTASGVQTMSTALQAVKFAAGSNTLCSTINSNVGGCSLTVAMTASNYADVLQAGDYMSITCAAGYMAEVSARKCGGTSPNFAWEGKAWKCVKTKAPTTKTKAPTTAAPSKSKSPSTSPTTGAPSKSVSPTTKTAAPTKEPTKAPTTSPTTSAPTKATKSPTESASPTATAKTGSFSGATPLSPKEFVTVLAVLVCTARLVV